MKAFIFSFGQDHVHRVNGTTFDCDCLVKIYAQDHQQSREIMFSTFGPKWCFQYDGEKENDNVFMSHFPRGVIVLNPSMEKGDK